MNSNVEQTTDPSSVSHAVAGDGRPAASGTAERAGASGASSGDPAPVIVASGLRKVYQRRGAEPVEAVSDLDLEVAAGEIFGFLGPNGAGKTTTVRILVTLLQPTAGRATVAGHDVVADAQRVREVVGYVSQTGGLDPAASARDLMLLQAGLHGMRRRDAGERIDALAERFDLGRLMDRVTGTYSGGERRLVSLALGMLHRPSVLFLDEPTIGLDPQIRSQLWEEVASLRRDGATVVITTHYLEEADALCDRVAIVHQGRIVAGGAPAAMKRAVGDDVITLEASAGLDEACSTLSSQPFVRHVERAEGTLRAYVDDGERSLPMLLAHLRDLELEMTSIQLTSPTLDDVFLRHTGQSMQESQESATA